MGGTSGEGTARSYRLQKTVLPGDTDYSGAVWHPNYLRYFEEARVQMLAKYDLGYHELVESRIELPVVEASMRYKRPARLGDRLIVDIEWQKVEGVRMLIHGEVRNAADDALLVTSIIQLVAVDMDTRRIARKLPESLKQLIDHLNDN